MLLEGFEEEAKQSSRNIATERCSIQTKVAYKGFNKDMTCLKFQYKEGHTFIHDTSEGVISLCRRGFHYCMSLSDVMKHYSKDFKTHTFAIVEPLGQILTSSDKCCTDKLKIVRILTEQEVEYILQEEANLYMEEKVYCIDLVRQLQSKYNFMIGGSISLFLQGLTLDRDAGRVDFDIIMPYYQRMRTEDLKEFGIEVEEFDGKSSGNDYSITYGISTNDGRFLKADVRICPPQAYTIVKYKDQEYKVCDLMTTIEAKARYAMEGNKKHYDDVASLLNFRKNNPDE